MRRDSGTAGVKLNLLLGPEAQRTLTDATHGQEWSALMERSVSATAFQGPAFARAWWRTYGATHDLGVIQGRNAAGVLVGQFVVVRGPNQAWRPIGTHQAEYPAVLAEDGNPAVVTAILRMMFRTLSVDRLRLNFLPPDTAVTAYASSCRASLIREQRRPLRRFADVSAPGKRSKSKLNMLRRLGARVDLLRSPDEIASLLEEFVPLHDDRQAAQGYGTPFRDDPLKVRFLISLAEEQLLHAPAMRIDGRLVAGILGVQDRTHLVLGLIAHAADLEHASPGASLIHELGEIYRGTEVDTLDLTPGDAYKERFATTADMTYAADLGWGIPSSLEITARRTIGPLVRRIRATVRRRIASPSGARATAGAGEQQAGSPTETRGE